MIRSYPARLLRSRRTRLVAAASAGVIAWSVASAAAALPTGGVVFDSTPGPVTTITPGSGTLTVDQGGDRVVIDWSTFNIATGETVTFNQPDAGAIAFNRVDPSAFTTIDGTLAANGGVWLFSPGGLLFGASAQVNVASFVGSTARLQDADATAALTANTITATDGGATGSGTLTVSSGAALTASNGYMVLLGETIVQNGSVVSNNDAVWYGVAEGGTLTIATSNTGQSLQDATVSNTTGSTPSFTQGATGVTTAGTWVGVSTPSISGWTTVLNLGGAITANGAKPGTQDGVVILTGADGAVDLTTGDTQLTTSGAIDSTYSISIDVNAATLNGDIGSAGAVAFYLTTSDDIVVNGDIYGTLISLESTGGDLTVGATSDIEAGHFAAGPAVRLYAYGDLTITAGATVTSLSDMILGVTDAGGTLYIGGSVYAFGTGSNGTANLIYSQGDLEIAAGALIDSAEATLLGAVGQTTISGTVDSTSGTTVFSSDLTVTSTGLVDSDGATELSSFAAAGTITIDGTVTSGTTTTIRAPNLDADLTIGGTGLLGSTGAVNLYASGDLNVDVDVTAPAIDLTTTNGSITVTSAVTGSIITLDSGDDILLTATADIDALSVALTGYGDTSISMTAAGDLTIVSGAQVDGRWDVYLETTGVASELSVNSVVHSGGLLSIDGSYNVTLGADADVNGFATALYSIEITAGNDLDIQSGAMIDAYDNMAMTATDGDLTFAGTAYGDFIDIDAGDDLTVASTGLFDINQFHADAVGDIQIDGVIDAPTTLFITSTGGDLTIGATADLSSFSVGLVAADQLTTAVGSNIDGDGGVGTLSLRAYGSDDADSALMLSGDITGQNVQLVTTAGSITLADGTITFNNNLNVYGSGGDFTTLAGSLITTSGSPINGNVDIQAAGNISLAGDVDVTSFNAATNTGDITVSGEIYANDLIDLEGAYIHLTGTAHLEVGTPVVASAASIDLAGQYVTTDAGSVITSAAGDATAGVFISGNSAFDTEAVRLSGSIYSGDVSVTTFSQSNINLAGGSITAVDDVTITSNRNVSTDATVIDAGDLVSMRARGDLTIGQNTTIDGDYVSLEVFGFAPDGSLLRVEGDVSAVNTIAITNPVGDVEIAASATLHGNTDASPDNGGPLGYQTDTIEIRGENITAEDGSRIIVGDLTDNYRGTVYFGSDDANYNLETTVTLAGYIQAEAVTVNVADGSLDLSGNLYTTGALNFDVSGAVTMDYTGVINADGYLTVTAGDGIDLNGVVRVDGDITLTTTNATADINIRGDIYAYGGIELTSAADINIYTGGALQADSNTYGGDGFIGLYAEGNVTTSVGSNLIVGNTGDTTGNVIISANGTGEPIDLSGQIYADGLGLIAAYGSIHLRNGDIYLYDSLAINSAYDFTMDGPATVHTGGDIDITAQGTMTVDGSLYAGGNISLYRYGGITYDLDMGGYLYAGGDVSIVNNFGNVEVSGTIYAGDVSIRTPYDGDIYVTNSALINASNDILIEAHYSGGFGEVVVNGDLDAANGDVDIRNLNGSLSVGLYASIYSYGNISLYRDGGAGESLSTVGLLHADGYVSIVNDGPGDVVLGGDIIADADTGGYPGFIYISSEGQVVASFGGTMLVGAVGSTTGDITINADGGDNAGYSAIDLNMDIDADGLYLNTTAGSVHLSGGEINLYNDFNVNAAVSFLMDSGAQLNDGGSVNISANAQISVYGGISAGGDIYLTLADSGSNGDLAVGGYLVAGNSVNLVNVGSGDVIIAASGDILAGASPYSGTPDIYISSQGHVISYAGSSLTVGEAGAPTGDVLIYAYGAGLAVDLSSDIDAQSLEITAPYGSVHLGDGAIALEYAFYLYSAYDITIDAPVSIVTPDDVNIEAGGTLIANGDVDAADITFTAGADLTVGGVVEGDDVTLNASGDLTVGADADILAYNTLLLNMNAPGDMFIYGDLASDYVSLVNPDGDILISGYLHGVNYGYNAIYVSAGGDLTVTGAAELRSGAGDIELRTTDAAGDLVMDGLIYGPDVTVHGAGDVTVSGEIYSFGAVYIGSSDTIQNASSVTIDGAVSAAGGLAIVNRNTGGVTFESNADVYTNDSYGPTYLVGPGGPTTGLLGQDGDIYIYSATQVITVAGSSIDATNGIGADRGLVTIVAGGTDGGGYSAIDLSGDISSYVTVLTADNGSIHLGAGTINVTEQFTATAGGDFIQDAGAAIDGTTVGLANIDVYAGGDIDLSGNTSGYYVHIETIGTGSTIDVSGYVYATDQIELFNFGGSIDIAATGELYVGAPQENLLPEIFVQAATTLTTAAGSYIHTDLGQPSGYISLRADADGGAAIDLAGDVATSGDVRVQVSGYGDLQITAGTIDAGGDVYVATYGQILIDGGVIDAGETVFFTSSNNMYLGGVVYAAEVAAHIYGGEASSVPGAAIHIDGQIYADNYIGIYNEVGAVELGATAILSSNINDSLSQTGAAVRIDGESVTSEAGSLIETPAGNAASDVLIQAFATTGTTVDLAGDIYTGTLTVNSFADGSVIIGGEIDALGDIIVNAAGALTIEAGADLYAADLVDLQSDRDMLIAGDVYGTYVRANIYGGGSGSGVDGSDITVDGNLSAAQTIEINNGVGDVEINGQVVGNLGANASQTFQAHFVQIYGENILTGAGSLIASGPTGARLGDVVLGTYNYYGDPTLVDLSGDVEAQSILFAIDNGSLRQRAGAVSAEDPITIAVDGYFQTDAGASIYSGGDVRVTSQDGMTVNGDITADRIFLTDYSASDLVVGGTLLTGSDINIRSVYDDIHLTADALLFADTDYFAPDPVYNHVYLEAGGQVRTDAGSSIQVGSLADLHGTIEITAHGIDGPNYSAVDLSGDISAYNVDIIADAGSIRLRDGDIVATTDVDFAAGRSFLMGADATLYTQGDASLTGVDGVSIGGTVTALGAISVGKLTTSAGAVTVSGELYAGEDIDIVNNGAGDVILGGATIVADYDGVAGTNSVYISAENGQVVLAGSGVIRVGAAGSEHGAIGIHAGGADSADFSSIDIAMDLTADDLTLTTDQGSIHLASGADIVVANDLTITSDLDIFTDAGSTITTDGDASLSAGRSLYALGDITAGGDIALQIGTPIIIIEPGPGGPSYFTPQPGAMVVGGAMTANGEIYLENFGGGDIYIDGTAAIRSDADNVGAGDGVTIFSYSQVITAAGSTINAGAPGAPTAGVSIFAGGADNASYSAIDLSGDIEGASLALYTEGSIHLRDGDITVTGDLIIGTYVDFLMDAGATIDAGDDVSIVAVNSLISQGDITAGGDISLGLDPDFYLYTGFTAGPGDMVVGGNVTANGSIDITNAGAGDIYIDGTAALTADADSTGGPDHIAIDSYGQVISASGSTMVVGAPGATTGDVSIVAAGLDGGGYSAITLGGDIDANGLTLDADAGSIHLTGGTITVTDDLVLTSALDVITEDASSIEAGADVSITAGRTLTARGDIDAAGAIALTLTGASTSDLTVAGIFYADDGISIVNNGTGDVLLDDGSMVWADFDGDASGGVYISSNGSVITSDQGPNGAEATIVVGGVGTPTGDVTIVADGAGVAIDLSGDIQAQNLFLNAANGSVYLRNGDIDLSNGLTIDSDFNVFMGSPATIESGGDVAMTAAGFLTVNGNVNADGDITLLLQGPASQDLTVGGLLASGGDINIDNAGLGDVLMSGSTSMFSTGLIDVTAGGDIVLAGFIDSATTFNADAGLNLTFDGQIQAGTGATLNSGNDMTLNGVMIVEGYNDFVATAGATLTQNSGASVQAGGDASVQSGADMAIYGTVDVLGDATFESGDDLTTGGVISGANVLLSGDDLNLGGSIIAISGDVVANADGYIYQDGVIQALDDVSLTSTYDMTINGDVTALDDIRLTVYGGEGAGDLSIDGNVIADGDVYVINNADYGGIFIGANADIVADVDGDSPGAYLDIYGHGFISAEAGSTLHVGGPGTRTGFITIYTDGTDGTSSAIDLAADIDAGAIEITAYYGSVEISGGTVAADESIVIYAAENFILGDGALISGAEDRAVDLPKATGVVVYGDYYLPPGVSIVAGDVDIQGLIASGDQIVIAAYNVDGGEVTVGGADGGLGTGFTLSNDEFQNLSADSIVVLAGQGSGYSTEGYDLHLADLTIDAANVDDVWFGTQEDIIVEGAVTPVGDGVSLHLGFTLAYTGEDDFAANTFLIGFVPDRILISGSLGSVDDAFGQVTLIAQGDILMGSQAFIDAAAADPEFNAAEDGGDFAPEEGHVFIASDVLQMASMGRILQQNTGGQGEYGGLVIGLPQVGQELIFVPDQLEGQTIGGTGGWLADYSNGPTRIELFGYFVSQTGEVTGFQAANVDNLLDPDILVGDYYFNTCLFYSSECAASGEDVPIFQSPFPPVDFTPLFDTTGSFFAAFPFEEPDEEEDDDEIQGEPVTGSGNEDLWTVKRSGVRP